MSMMHIQKTFNPSNIMNKVPLLGCESFNTSKKVAYHSQLTKTNAKRTENYNSNKMKID